MRGEEKKEVGFGGWERWKEKEKGMGMGKGWEGGREVVVLLDDYVRLSKGEDKLACHSSFCAFHVAVKRGHLFLRERYTDINPLYASKAPSGAMVNGPNVKPGSSTVSVRFLLVSIPMKNPKKKQKKKIIILKTKRSLRRISLDVLNH